MKKNVGLITLISIFIPGGGQIYLGEYLKGLLILLLAWLVLPWLYGIYDAHATASGFNRELYDLIYPGQMLAEAESVKIPVHEE
jgi:TM2 domain-containing membrane protein YozV